ncbi:hypothetical protein [Mycobacteroides abscessus]|uniref:hypothetical protein n=1 Tax=Mycobacteroides abscessus TaxID=36809 RepID=UPI0009A6C1B2|nr:hypothetical protein [Mycobacteroides abscessus]SLH39017.1 Uncharacterised protein [Mycobacteroides abscessus subsp. massiliense]
MSDQEPFAERTYALFNRRRTIGVKSGHGGATKAIHLDPAVAKMSERAAAQEIMNLAQVGSQRGLLSLREEVEEAAEKAGTTVDPCVWDVLDDVPTHEQYEQLKRTKLGT